MSRTLMILGTLGVLAAVGECAFSLESYIRHMASGDQAGAALGMLFVIGYISPVAAAVLTIGAVPMRLREQAAGCPPKPARWISGVLIVMAVLMAVFTVLYVVDLIASLIPRASTFPLATGAILGYGTYAAALAALVCNILGIAIALWAGPLLVSDGGPRWLGPLLAWLAAVPLLNFIALLMVGIPTAGPFWTAALMWAAVSLRQGRRSAPSGDA